MSEIVKDEKRWNELNAPLFLALYAWLHIQVYGVDPSDELTGKSGLAALNAAKRMLDADFNGHPGDMLMFVRWVWYREVEREKWRAANNRQGGRISWRYQFSAQLLNDYKVMKRKNTARPIPRKSEEDYPTDSRAYAFGT